MTLFTFVLFGETCYVRAGFWILLLPVLCWHLLRTPFVIASQRFGRKERAIARGRWFVLLVLLTVSIYWLQAAYARATPYECFTKGPSPYGPYKVEVCLTAGRVRDGDTEGVVRLRSTSDDSVLAKEEFHNSEFDRIYWELGAVTVGSGDGSALIRLPPTWLDKVRAKLP